MDYQVQVVTLPVSDVDQAVAFYTERAGFTLDVDYHPVPGFRVAQLTLPGSACSVQVGTDPGRRDYASMAGFADPDGNTWVIQEIGYRAGGERG